MHSTNVIASAVGLLAALAAPAVAQESSYFVMYSAPPLVAERLDPLLSAGGVSGHSHSVIGGNGFAATMDFAQTQKATCGTLAVKADKSNYWMPSLYYQSPKNGSFTRVMETNNMRIYYKFGTGGNGVDLERSEFPQGFRMITGNAMLRSDDGSMGSPGNQLNWMCHDGSKDQPRATGFPSFTNCDEMGLAATMRFPSCWNGDDFDPAKPLAHMDFPMNKDGLAGCRAPFNKKRFPEIMVEYWLDVSPFTGDYGINDKPFVLAPGDNTGYSFHIDFINGWEPGVLAKAMKTCRVGNTAHPLDSDTCFGANSLYTNDQKKACKVAPTVNEDVGTGTWIKALPGCNPIQAGPANATPQKNCPNGGSSGTGTGNTGSTPVSKASTMATSASTMAGNTVTPVTKTTAAVSPSETSTSSSGGSSSGGSDSVKAADGSTWTFDGCYVDAVNPRTLPTNGWWGNKITNAECAKGCSKMGFSFAGTEYSGQCYCGKSLSSKKVAASECNMPCAGDSSQKCGGPARLSVYKKAGATKKHHRAHRRHADSFFASS